MRQDAEHECTGTYVYDPKTNIHQPARLAQASTQYEILSCARCYCSLAVGLLPESLKSAADSETEGGTGTGTLVLNFLDDLIAYMTVEATTIAALCTVG